MTHEQTTLAQAEQLEAEATNLRNQGNSHAAISVYQQAKDFYQRAGHLARAAGCQHMIGVCHKIDNDLEKALAAYQEASALYLQGGDALGPGRVMRDVGIMYEYHDRLQEAEHYLTQSRHSLEAIPEDVAQRTAELGITIAKLGLLKTRQGDHMAAESLLAEGLGLVRKSGHAFYEMTTLLHFGALDLDRGHTAASLTHLQAALGVIYTHNMQDQQTRRLAQIWGLMAHCYAAHDNVGLATQYTKKALAFIERLPASAQVPLLKDVKANELKARLHIL